MVLQAPLELKSCADSFRTREWGLSQRYARAGFADFISWHVASFNAIILSQTAALAFESHGLGICCMGTTLHSMGAIQVLPRPINRGLRQAARISGSARASALTRPAAPPRTHP